MNSFEQKNGKKDAISKCHQFGQTNDMKIESCKTQSWNESKIKLKWGNVSLLKMSSKGKSNNSGTIIPSKLFYLWNKYGFMV